LIDEVRQVWQGETGYGQARSGGVRLGWARHGEIRLAEFGKVGQNRYFRREER